MAKASRRKKNINWIKKYYMQVNTIYESKTEQRNDGGVASI